MKQYILKPGNHQFAPGSPAIHSNENTTDAEAKWYLEKYPHIKSLFEKLPNEQPVKPFKRKRKGTKKVDINVELQKASE